MVPFGGHNLLEPAAFGSPVLFGVYTHNFVRMAQLLPESGGGIVVKDGKDLFSTIKRLLSCTERSKIIGMKAREFVEMNRGALNKIMEHIGDYIEPD